MAEIELVKMPPKGQLVVPQAIGKEQSFKPSDRFSPFSIKGVILFKKVKIPNIKVEFASLIKDIEKQFTKQKVAEKDGGEAVKWARKRQS